MERGRADFRGPTTGVIVGDTLFYVANAQIGPFDPRKEGGSLAPVVVLKMPLKCGKRRGIGLDRAHVAKQLLKPLASTRAPPPP
jgi:hypothetical protein